MFNRENKKFKENTKATYDIENNMIETSPNSLRQSFGNVVTGRDSSESFG